jgi:tripartite-type tricarboxylate transporter receptor subunit TctC
MRISTSLAGLLCVAVSICPLASRAVAQDAVARFYRGKTVAITVGTPPGSSLSFYSQALSHHMGRHLPGAPGFIVQHMPGAGGLTAANYAYNRAPRDGTVLIATNRTVPIEPLLGGRGAQFDALKFSWIGSTTVDHTTCVTWHTAAVKTLADAFKKEAVIGSYGAEGPSAISAKSANKLTGTKFKVIAAYQGGPEAVLAMERSEVDGFCAMSWSELKLRKPDWLADKRVNLLFQSGLEPHPDIPEVPLIADYARTPQDRAVFELLFAPLQMGRPFYAPPSIPADRLNALRTAFESTLKDPRFLAETDRMGLDIAFVGGAAIRQLLEQLYASPVEVIERARTIAE